MLRSVVSRKCPPGRFALSHFCRSARTHAVIFRRKITWVRPLLPFPSRTGWDSNPRGREPTRFPIVRLKPLGHPSTALGAADGHKTIFLEASGMDAASPRRLAEVPPGALRAARSCRSARTLLVIFLRKITWVQTLQSSLSTEGVGFEPTRCCHQRLSRAPP